jgi:hypothetical protein
MIKNLLYCSSLFLALVATNNAYSQTTVSIPLTQGNGEDTYLASGSPSTNFGSHGSLGGNTW